MNRPPRYLNLDDKVPSRKWHGMTVRECIDHPQAITYITWIMSDKGFQALNCKLNGGEAQEYYFAKMNQIKRENA
jgi:hypothetical protein